MVALLETNQHQPIPLSRNQLMNIRTPEPTLSWSPLPHHELLEKVESRLVDNGMKIRNCSHTTSHGNARYFGTVELCAEPGRDYRRMVGIRNSHDKRHSASIVAGARVVCCANGMFTGEFLCLARKHTSRLHEDLDERLDESFGRLLQEWVLNDRRISMYKEKRLSDADAHDLLVRAMDADALPPSAIPKILREWREPWHAEFHPRNAWSLHNAVTETLKEKVHLIPDRTRKLQQAFDATLGIA